MAVEAFLFDLDGVVIDTEAVWDEEARISLGRSGLTYDRTYLKPLLAGKSLVEGAAIIVTTYGLSVDPRELAALRRKTFIELLGNHVTFVPGFMQFYETVRRGYRTCIATGMDGGCLEAVDRKIGLRALFDGHVYNTESVEGKSKPAPDLFLYAAWRLGVDPSRCVVIEDSPSGVLAANRANMACIALSTTFPPSSLKGADVVVEGFSQIDILCAQRAVQARDAAARSKSL